MRTNISWLRASARSFVAYTLTACIVCPGVASAAELSGHVEQEAPLQPSLHLIPAGATKSQPIPGQINAQPNQYSGQVTQFAGSAQKVQGGVPTLRSSAPYYPGGRGVNVIAPITDYRLTPKTGVMFFGGSSSETPPTSVHGVSNFAGSYSATSGHSGVETTLPGGETYRSSHGVTSASGYQISRMPVAPGTPAQPGGGYSIYTRSGGDSRHGVTAYAPQYEIHQSDKGSWSYIPGNAVRVSGSRPGVVAYVPGFEVRLSSTGVEQSTLGGMWSVPEVRPQLAVAGQFPRTRTYAQLLSPNAHPLMAKAQLWPGLVATDKATDWKMWYDRVAKAIYLRWQYSDVGAGTAKVKVNVTRGRDVSCEIIDFEPAPDVLRDAAAETAFRETALRAVRLVTTAEIPDFPSGSDSSDVSFNIEMKRRADGKAGFEVDPAAPTQTEARVTATILKH